MTIIGVTINTIMGVTITGTTMGVTMGMAIMGVAQLKRSNDGFCLCMCIKLVAI